MIKVNCSNNFSETIHGAIKDGMYLTTSDTAYAELLTTLNLTTIIAPLVTNQQEYT